MTSIISGETKFFIPVIWREQIVLVVGAASSREIKLESEATSLFDVQRSMFSPRRRLYEPEAMFIFAVNLPQSPGVKTA